jgi:hypothetical protein
MSLGGRDGVKVVVGERDETRKTLNVQMRIL